MVSADQPAEGYSAVFFMDGGQVARQMRASEFGAFLDGYVGLSDLAETDVRAVLVYLSGELRVTALVFFRIWFDEEGRADVHWNVPIEDLAMRGAKGPDLGSGPIRLVCRSQCPDPRYAQDLWDPDMTPGNNHFHAIRKAVEANSLRFIPIEPARDEDIPVLNATPAGQDASEAADAAHRVRLAQLIREQRLRIKTLQSVHRDSLAEIQREHRLEIQGLRTELSDLEQKYERQRLSNEQLKQRLAERNEQYLSMQEQLSSGAEGLREEANTGAELVLLREQFEHRQRELEFRDERISMLERELDELRQKEPAESTIMEELRKQSVFLVGYHPGIGHITLPFEDIETYFINPVAYAAERCGLNEPAYREWLEHYENPECRHAGEDGKPCGEPVMRISQPGEFRPGIHDRCEKHQD